METADMFLVFGEKIAELQTAGHHAFFDYMGHVDYYSFYVYDGKWDTGKGRAIDESCSVFDNRGEFVEKCLRKANLLMLKSQS